MFTKTSKRLIALAAILLIGLSPVAEAGPRGGGGGGGRSSGSSFSRPSSRPSSPSISPSRTSQPSRSSSPSASRPSAPSRPAQQSQSSKVSPVQTPAINTNATPPSKPQINATSGGRNSSVVPQTTSKSTSTALSGDTKSRSTTISNNAGSSGRNSSLTTPSKTPQISAADRALYERAKQSGKVYENREQATADFRKQYANQYKTSGFTSEPSVRPNYIPSYTSFGGNNYTVVYNRSYGGYGYWSGGGYGLGTFMLYDALSNAVMMESLMSQRGYYYGTPPPPVAGSSAVGFIFLIIALVVVILVGTAIFARI